MAKKLAFRGETNIHYTIAAPSSLYKERADLDLTGAENSSQAIREAIDNLEEQRESDDVAIVIEFLGGDIDISTSPLVTDNSIKVYHSNVHLIGNNTNIFGSTIAMAIGGANCSVTGFNMSASGNIAALAVGNDNITIRDCNIKSENGMAIYFTNSRPEDDEPLVGPSNIKIFNNTLWSPSNNYCIYALSTAAGTIIIGNRVLSGTLSVKEGMAYPGTAELLSQLNVVAIENVEVRS